MQELTQEMKHLNFKLYNAAVLGIEQSEKEDLKNFYNPQLTKREFEIIELMSKGLSNEGICKILWIAPTTLACYRNRIYQKYQIQSSGSTCRVQAVLKHLKHTGRLKDF